jgi:hypothetical protein
MNEKNLSKPLKSRKTKTGRRRWGCLDEAQIAAYADHQVAGREKECAEAHLADCDYCLEQVGFLVRTRNAEMAEAVPESLLLRARKLAGPIGNPKGSTVWIWGKFAGATAVACLLVVTAISLRQTQSPTNPGVAPRQNPISQPIQPPAPVAPTVPAERHPEVRGGQNSLLAPKVIFPVVGSAIQANQFEFRWEPISGAREYEVEVLNLEGDLMWKQRVVGSSIRLQSDVGLKAGQKYFVSVRAYLDDGRSVLGTPVSFTVPQR